MSQLLLFGQITRLDSMERRSTLPHEPAKYIFEPSLYLQQQLLMIGFMTMAFDTNLSVGWRARCDKTFLCIGYLVGKLIQKVLENRYLRVCYPTGLFQRLCSIIRYLISNWSDDRSQLDITAVIWQQQQLQTSKMEMLWQKKKSSFINCQKKRAKRRYRWKVGYHFRGGSLFATGSHQMLFSDKIVIVKIFGFTKFYRLLIFHYCAVLKLPLELRRKSMEGKYASFRYEKWEWQWRMNWR